MLRCKPGDLAIVVTGTKYAGKLLEVLEAAPPHEFKLPDGQINDPCPPGYWVVKILGAPIPVVLRNGVSRLAPYGTCGDHQIRPLRGLPEDETLETERVALTSTAEHP